MQGSCQLCETGLLRAGWHLRQHGMVLVQMRNELTEQVRELSINLAFKKPGGVQLHVVLETMFQREAERGKGVRGSVVRVRGVTVGLRHLDRLLIREAACLANVFPLPGARVGGLRGEAVSHAAEKFWAEYIVRTWVCCF